MKNTIIVHNGSVQNIPEILDDVYLGEPQKKVLDLAADRSAYICQSQSLKCPPSGADARSINKYAFLWVEEGSEDGDILPWDEARCACYSAYGRPERSQGREDDEYESCFCRHREEEPGKLLASPSPSAVRIPGRAGAPVTAKLPSSSKRRRCEMESKESWIYQES